MHVLHIDTGREMRGGQWQALYLTEALASAGHRITLLARAGSPLLESARRKGLDVRPGGLAALATTRADIIHAHDARAHMLAALAGRAPLVVSRRVAFPIRRDPFSAWKYAAPRHFIAVSGYVRRMLLDAAVEEAHISLVYDGVPIPAAPSTRSAGHVIAPASDDPLKGAALLQQAALLAGIRVEFSANLAGDLTDAAVLAYVTHSEGLGSAALLAMAAGVPVVASRVGGLPEAVEDGETGLLVENEPAAIAAAIRRLLEDAALGDRMASAARSRAQERFTIGRMVEGVLQVYHRILAC